MRIRRCAWESCSALLAGAVRYGADAGAGARMDPGLSQAWQVACGRWRVKGEVGAGGVVDLDGFRQRWTVWSTGDSLSGRHRYGQ